MSSYNNYQKNESIQNLKEIENLKENFTKLRENEVKLRSITDLKLKEIKEEIINNTLMVF